MAITYIGAATATNISATTVTVGDPASTAEDDLYIAWCSIQDDDTTTGATWDTPSGWTKLAQQNSGTAFFSGDGVVAVFYRLRGASPVGDTAFSLTSSTASEIRATIAAYRGVNTASPFDVTYASGSHFNAVADDLTPNAPAITTETNAARVVLLQWFNLNAFPDGAAVAPSGYTLDYSVVTDTARHHNIASKEVATAGPESPGAWQHTSTGVSDSLNITVALRPAATVTYSLDLQPLYLGATLLASKTDVEFTIKSGHTGIDGETQASGVNGTIDASGIFQVPGGYTSTTADDVTVALYWEEGSAPVVDRSLIVKTTLVEDV